MNKRHWTLLTGMTLGLCLTLSGCGQATSEESAASATPKTTAPKQQAPKTIDKGAVANVTGQISSTQRQDVEGEIGIDLSGVMSVFDSGTSSDTQAQAAGATPEAPAPKPKQTAKVDPKTHYKRPTPPPPAPRPKPKKPSKSAIEDAIKQDIKLPDPAAASIAQLTRQWMNSIVSGDANGLCNLTYESATMAACVKLTSALFINGSYSTAANTLATSSVYGATVDLAAGTATAQISNAGQIFNISFRLAAEGKWIITDHGGILKVEDAQTADASTQGVPAAPGLLIAPKPKPTSAAEAIDIG